MNILISLIISLHEHKTKISKTENRDKVVKSIIKLIYFLIKITQK